MLLLVGQETRAMTSSFSCHDPAADVCGTDTDCGQDGGERPAGSGPEARYWKPVQCGLEDGGDSKRVRRL